MSLSAKDAYLQRLWVLHDKWSFFHPGIRDIDPFILFQDLGLTAFRDGQIVPTQLFYDCVGDYSHTLHHWLIDADTAKGYISAELQQVGCTLWVYLGRFNGVFGDGWMRLETYEYWRFLQEKPSVIRTRLLGLFGGPPTLPKERVSRWLQASYDRWDVYKEFMSIQEPGDFPRATTTRKPT